MQASEGGSERLNEWQAAHWSTPPAHLESRPACQSLGGRGDTPDLLSDGPPPRPSTSSQLSVSEITGSIFNVLRSLAGYHALSQHEKVIVLGGKTAINI